VTEAALPPQSNWDRESLVLSDDDMRRAFKRMAHEIVERNGRGCDLVLAGIPTRGVPMAARLAAILNAWGSARAEILELPVEGHRDDREPGSGGRLAYEALAADPAPVAHRLCPAIRMSLGVGRWQTPAPIVRDTGPD